MKRQWILALGVVLVVLGAGGLFLRTKINPEQAGIQIEATPQATVYINDQEHGATPFEKTLSPGEITLRLVPAVADTPLSPWTTKLTLTRGVKTIVRRNFGETEGKSSGEVLSFEKIPGNSSSLAVVSSPDSAEIVVDGERLGFTPSRRDSLPAGQHQIHVSRPGFSDKDLTVTTKTGYKLTVVVILAESPSPEATVAGEATSSAAKSAKSASVEILDTPTGFLRVRTEPSTSATEAAQVKPGEKFPYLEQNKDGSWFKIEYEKGKQGWVFSQYAKKP
ncbi:MAG: PEGA domain-containing protein [Candidatus Blackburnbacteria bacterium]|nr:PEGA domain-containing protein [Candidatus Blackburnbacteria bacterium]